MNQPDDSANLTVPASSLAKDAIANPPAVDQYTSAEGPQAVRDRAAKLASKNADELLGAVNRLEGRIRWLYLVMVVFVIVLGVPVTQAVESTYHNCLRQNSALDYFNVNAQKSPLLTPAQKAERDRHYADLKGHCSGIWPFQP